MMRPTFYTWLLLLSGATQIPFAAAATITDSLRLQLQQAPADTERVNLLRNLAFELLHSSPDSAQLYCSEGKALASRLGFTKGLAMIGDMEGNILRAQGHYPQALASHLRALHLFDSLNFTRGIRSTCVNTGTDYFYLKNYSTALAYYQRALKLTDTSEHDILARIFNNIGSVYTAQGNYSRALQTYKKALPYVMEDASGYSQSSIYSSMAIALAQLKNMPEAIRYMLLAIDYQKRSGNKSFYAASATSLGGFYIETGDYPAASFWLQEALAVATEIHAPSVIANYYRNMALLRKKQGKHPEAYDYLEKYTSLNDSLIHQEHISSMAEMEQRYQVDVKNRELALLGKEKQLNESRLKVQTLWKTALAIILVVTLLLLFVSWRNVQLKSQANRLLQQEKKQVEQDKEMLEIKNLALQHENILAQYETLKNQVNPHFLFNSLNALASLIKTDPESALRFTAVFSRLYRSVLELKSYTVITLAEEMQLADDYIYLQKIRFGNNLQVEKNLKAAALKKHLPPFCVQMLIENAVKHNIISDHEPLRITIQTDHDRLLVKNSLNPRHNKAESTGVGITNMVERFSLLDERIPEFTLTNTEYIARLPLLSIPS